jgi:sterol desaturase/sphingolipid hydroxylase (fatty acid hydroxylase superfamily)
MKRKSGSPVAGLGGICVLGVVAAVMFAERRWPLRRRREQPARHVARDAAMAAMSTAATAIVQSIVLRPALRRLRSDRNPFRIAVQVLLLDYTLWMWHLLNHRIPLLWRFHRVHHVDLDLDAATGARFHFGEMSLSTLFRLLQVLVIRPDPRALSIWQTMLLSSIFFHHSNTALPGDVDRALAHVVVTPRMHGIHHSTEERETNSNFASLFTIWDAIHGVFRLDVPQESITIGVPAYQREEDVTLDRLVVMPLRDTEDDWLASV